MPWVRLDDNFAEKPELERAGPLAAWLHIAATCYSARHLTDGRIPKAKARRLTDVPSPAKHIKALLAAGLWIDDGDDYVLSDYNQPTREQIEAEREKEREKKRRQREAGMSQRDSNGQFLGTQGGNTRGSPQGTTEGTPPGSPEGSPTVPVPSRPTDVVTPSSDLTPRAGPARQEEGSETLIDQAIRLASQQYARQQMDSGQGKSMPGLARWWLQEHAETARERAAELLENHNLSASQLAGILTGNANTTLLNATRKRPQEEPQQAAPDTVKGFAAAARHAIEHPHTDPGDET